VKPKILPVSETKKGRAEGERYCRGLGIAISLEKAQPYRPSMCNRKGGGISLGGHSTENVSKNVLEKRKENSNGPGLTLL